MRYLSFLLFLVPAPAFACAWTYVDSAPLAYLWCSVFISAIAGVAYGRRGPEKKSLLPEALVIASILAGLGLGALDGSSDWANLSPAKGPAIFIASNWLMMRWSDKPFVQVLLGVIAVLGLLLSLSVTGGDAVSGFTEVEMTHDVVF